MLRRLLALLVATAMLAVACGSDGDSAEPADTATNESAEQADTSDADQTDADEADSADADQTDADEADTSEAPPADTSFVYANPFSFFDVDPSSSFSSENILLQNVYETLTVYNAPGSADLLSPGLATSWESNDDSTFWTFNLRDDVTFHDGTAMTADDVIASINRTQTLDLGPAFIFLSIIEMNAPDPQTIEFTLEFPAPLDLVMSSNYGAYVMSAEAAATTDAEWFNAGNSGGTGPYKITSYDPTGSTMLTQHTEYWDGWDDNQITDVEFRLIEDPVLAEQLVRAGDVDYTYNLPFDSYNALDGTDGVNVVRGVSMTNVFGLLNHERLSAELREALVLSFPYNDIADALYGGEGNRAEGIVPKSVWGAASGLKLPDTDLARAGELVAAAGASGSQLVYSYDAGTVEQQQIGEVWKANLSTIGIDLVLEPLTFDARLEIAQSDPANAQDIFTMFWFPTYVTPFDFMFSLFATEEEPFFNLGYYSNFDFDDLIFTGDAITATDLDGAIAAYGEAQQILIDDNAAVFMLDVPDVSVMADDVDGYVQNPAYSNVVRFYELTRG